MIKQLAWNRFNSICRPSLVGHMAMIGIEICTAAKEVQTNNYDVTFTPHLFGHNIWRWIFVVLARQISCVQGCVPANLFLPLTSA